MEHSTYINEKNEKLLEMCLIHSSMISETTINKKNPAVSIITRVYNGYEYIGECAYSVISQTFSDFEWLILDNGSTDETKIFLKKIADADPRIRLYRNEKNYLSVNPSSEGLLISLDIMRMMHGEYMTWLDGDDFFEQNFLEEMYKSTIGKTPDVVVCGANQFNDEKGKKTHHRIPPYFYTNDMALLGNDFELYIELFGTTWAKFFHKEFYLDNLDWIYQRPSYLINGSDTYTSFRTLKVAKSLACVPLNLYNYRIREGSIFRSRFHPERHLGYGVVYNEGINLIEYWDKFTNENLELLTKLHIYSIAVCIDTVLHSENMSAWEMLNYIAVCCNDKTLSSYYHQTGKLRRYSFLFMKIHNVCASIEQLFAPEDSLKYYDHYIYRLYLSLIPVNRGSVFGFMSLLSAVFDKNNQSGIGMNLLIRYTKLWLPDVISIHLKNSEISIKQILSDKEFLIYLINMEYDKAAHIVERYCESHRLQEILLKMNIKNENALMLKEKICEAVESANWDLAENLLNTLGFTFLLDKHVLQYRIKLCIAQKKYGYAQIYNIILNETEGEAQNEKCINIWQFGDVHPTS